MALWRNGVLRCSRALRYFSAETTGKPANRAVTAPSGRRPNPETLVNNDDLLINKFLNKDKKMCHDDWNAVRKDLLSSEQFFITEDRVDNLVVNVLMQKQKMNEAMDYLEFASDTLEELNLAAMNSYMKLCYSKEGAELSEKDKKYLIAMYDTVRQKHPVLDGTTGECCVMGISRTDRWKESLELLDMIKLSCKPRSATYSAIISAAFQNDEPEIAWKFLVEAVPRVNPDFKIYIDYAEYCLRHFSNDQLIDSLTKMFVFWGDHDIRPSDDVIAVYEKIFHTLGWRTERTRITQTAVCRSCAHRLENVKGNREDFEKLARTVRDRMIIGEDVYRRTSPKELQEFLQFVERSKPWDIIIDGLNVAHIAKNRTRIDGVSVMEIVRKCLVMGKRVLVLGRKHMIRWPKLNLPYIKKHAHIFLADNGTQDDPYLLYAAMVSGPDTMFVSRDLMRQHKFLLEDVELKKIFLFWQITHQMRPIARTEKTGGLEFSVEPPLKYTPVVQNDANGWHVPYSFQPAQQLSVEYEPPIWWVCFRKGQS